MKEKLKRIVTGILMCMLVLTQLPANVFADEITSSITGTGTEDDPYIVTTSDEFVTYLPKGYVKLGNDIQLEYSDILVNKVSGIDLNGHVLDFSNASGSEVISVDNTKFHIKDSAPETTHNPQFVTSDGTELRGGILTGYKHDEYDGETNTCFYMNETEFIMSGGTFYNNVTISGGTCLTFRASNVEISNAGFYDNKSNWWSSCIWFNSGATTNSSIKLDNCKFIGNTAKSATVIGSDSSDTVINSCIIKDNITANDGVVYGLSGAAITIKDTTITGNTNTVDSVGGQNIKVAGVYVEKNMQIDTYLKLDGKVVITGNTVNGMERNLYYTNLDGIGLKSGFDKTSKIGITHQEELYDSYDRIAVSQAADFIDCFSSDAADGELYVKDGNINLRKISHVHELGTKHEAVEATCISAGSKEYYDCTGCGKKIDAEKNIIYNIVIPATGKHISSDWITDKEATTTSEGSRYKECTVCKTVIESETIPKLESVEPKPGETKPSDQKPSGSESGTAESGKIEKRNTNTLALNNDINSLSSSLLTDKERELVKNGADAVVYTSLGAETDKSDLEKVNAALGSLTLGKAYDINLWVQVGDNAARQITSTSEKINLSLKVDDSLINKNDNIKRTYKVIRIHDGVATVLEGSFDAATQMFTFETDLFSTYALTYVDTIVSPEPGITPPDTTPAPVIPTITPQPAPAVPTIVPQLASPNASQPASASPAQNAGSPKTGDTSPSLWIFAIIIIAGAGIIVYGLRRRHRNA